MFSRWMAGLIVALTLVEGGACVAATSGEPGEAKAIERTIRAQIAAFSRDDAPAAFAFATPAIQKTFGGDSDRFLRAVRESYPAVYRPTSLFFLPPKKGRESWVQVVNIADSDGKLWLAYYDMRRQADKTWKINGCELVETDTVAT